MFGSRTTKLTLSNEKINDIAKAVKSLEVSGLLIKGGSEWKQLKGTFLSMLLGRC